MGRIQKAINALVAQQHAAKDYGFTWDDICQLVHHVRSECDEVEEALKSGHKAEIVDEIGDLVRGAITLCYIADLDVAELLEKGNYKFQKRFDIVKSLVEKEGLANLRQAPYGKKLAYWTKAKKHLAQAP